MLAAYFLEVEFAQCLKPVGQQPHAPRERTEVLCLGREGIAGRVRERYCRFQGVADLLERPALIGTTTSPSSVVKANGRMIAISLMQMMRSAPSTRTQRDT